MTKLIAGNWKMHGDKAFAVKLTHDILRNASGISHELLICPSFVHIPLVLEAITGEGSDIKLGAQNCASFEQGAHTGDVSADMLKDAGCDYVILGHSERRQNQGETNAGVKMKAEIANKNGLKTIICVGETLEKREAGQAQDVVGEQLEGSLSSLSDADNTVIAYEPVWAIGTGKTASLEDIQEMHEFIKEKLAPKGDFRILYGGSVKPENAKEILSIESVNGALIGGASLKADSFIDIAKAV